MRYPVQSRDWSFAEGYEFLSFTNKWVKIMVKT